MLPYNVPVPWTFKADFGGCSAWLHCSTVRFVATTDHADFRLPERPVPGHDGPGKHLWGLPLPLLLMLRTMRWTPKSRALFLCVPNAPRRRMLSCRLNVFEIKKHLLNTWLPLIGATAVSNDHIESNLVAFSSR